MLQSALGTARRRRNHRTKQLNRTRPSRRRLLCELLEERRMLTVVSVITHGFQLAADDAPDWAITMGQAVLERADHERAERGDSSDVTGSLFMYDATGDFIDATGGSTTGPWLAANEHKDAEIWNNSNSPEGEVALVFDWAWESDWFEDGWLEGAADALFAALLCKNENLDGAFQNKSFFDIAKDSENHTLDFHFIGHSRGAVLNSLVTERFAYHFPDYKIDQVTSLDPHPMAGSQDPGYNSVSPHDSVLRTYENVVFADNYYRQNGEYEDIVSFWTLGNHDGVKVPDVANYELDDDVLGEGIMTPPHSRVHTWYYGTITEPLEDFEGYEGAAQNNDGKVGFDDYWYSQTWDRETFGYYFSQVVRSDKRPDAPGHFEASFVESVFNGSFEHTSFGHRTNSEKSVTTIHLPGWQTRLGSMDSLYYYGRLDFGLGTATLARHNPLYFPVTTEGLRFDYEITNTDKGWTQDDKLEIYISDEMLDTIPLYGDSVQRNVKQSANIDISRFRDQVHTITFKLDYGSKIQSRVYIDNVAILTEQEYVGNLSATYPAHLTESEDRYGFYMPDNPTGASEIRLEVPSPNGWDLRLVDTNGQEPTGVVGYCDIDTGYPILDLAALAAGPYFVVVTGPTEPEGAPYSLSFDIPYERAGATVMSVIDVSGSMKGDQLVDAKTAAKTFIDLMNPGDRIGIASFSSSASVPYSLTEIDAGSTVKNHAKNAVNSLAAGGNTSIGAGIVEATEQFASFPEAPHQAMIVMTDGKENRAPWAKDVIQNEVPDDVVIYTIGFAGGADMSALQELAEMRGGLTYDAPTGHALTEMYLDIVAAAGIQSPLLNWKGSVNQDQTASRYFHVDSSAKSTTLTLAYEGSDLDVTLVDPDGNVVPRASQDGVEFEEQAASEFYRIDSPTPGTWQVVVEGVDVPSDDYPFTMRVFSDSNISSIVTTGPGTYDAGSPVRLEVQLDEMGVPVTGGYVTGTVQPPENNLHDSFDVLFRDDGQGSDAVADDGIYTAMFEQSYWEGEYSVDIDVFGFSNLDFIFTRELNTALNVTGSVAVGDLVVDMRDYPIGQDGVVDDLQIEARMVGANLEVAVTNLTSPGVGDGVYCSEPADLISSLTLLGSDDNERFVVEPNDTVPIHVDGRGPTFEGLGSDSNPGGDHLEVVFAGTTGRDLTYEGRHPSPGRPAGSGKWEFGSGHETIEFRGIESLDYFEVLAVSQDAGRRGRSSGMVRVYDAETSELVTDLAAFPPDHRTGLNVTVADVNGSGIPEVIVAPGPNLDPEVKIFQLHKGGLGSQLGDPLLAYPHEFRDGLRVAAGDVTGDGQADIVTAPMRGVAEVRVFTNQGPEADQWMNPDPARQFAAFPTSFTGGASVDVGDLFGQGTGQIVVGSGSGMRATVNVFDPTLFGANDYRPSPVRQFLPFDDRARGGTDVALGRVREPGLEKTLDLIVAAGRRGASQVEVLDGRTGALPGGTTRTPAMTSIQAYNDGSLHAPVRVAAKDVDADGTVEVFTAQGTNGRSGQIKRWSLDDPLNPLAVDLLLLNQSPGWPGYFLG